MTWLSLYGISGIVVLLIAVYLIVALLLPDKF